MGYKRRPFYLIAHRCNNVEHLRRVLNKCFNALEIDVRANDARDALVVDHDGCYSWSTGWSTWLTAAEALPQELIDRWALLIFDIKEVTPFIADTRRDSMRRSKIKNVPRSFSICSVEDADVTFTSDFLGSLNELETVDVSYNQPAEQVDEWLRRNGFSRGWYADGINASGIGHSQEEIDRNLFAAMQLRDSGRANIQRVYSWTYELDGSLKEKIMSGCDGLIVNTGGNLNGVGDSRYYAWADQFQSIIDDNPVSQVAFLAGQNDFISPPPSASVVRFRSRFNSKYMVAPDGICNNSLIYCRDGDPLTFLKIGPDSQCCFHVPGRKLFLSFRDASGAVKLYDSFEKAIYKLEACGDTFNIYDIHLQQYMWVSGDEPYISDSGNPRDLNAQWIVEEL